MSNSWDSNMLKKLKALWVKGLSMSEIGKKLGVSKNAVVGKINRMGWNAKETSGSTGTTKKQEKTEKTVKSKKPIKPVIKKPVAKRVVEKKETKKATPVKKAKAEATKKEKPVIKTASKKSKKDLILHELLIKHAMQMASLKTNQCRWPIGDPDSDKFHFCGETVFPGKPYCYEHCRQAYQFTPVKKKQ